MNPLRGRVLVLAALLLGPAGVSAGPAEKGPAPRLDLYGDPLPDGAVARLGSVRFRHAGLSDYFFLPGGKTALTSGSDRVLRFWNVETGREVRAVKLQGSRGPGRAVTLSPDGKLLAAHDGADVVVWEVESGKELKTLPAPKANLGFLYFSPDGKALAVGRGDWRVSWWDWAAGKERQFPLAFEPRPVVQFLMDSSFHGGFSPDGKWFVAGASCNEPLGVFEAATGREVHRFRCHAITSTVSPDSKRLAVCGYKNDRGGREAVLRLFDLASGKEAAQFPMGHEECFHSLAFSPDGKLLACGFSDRSCVVDTATGRVLHRLSGRPVAMAFSPDGKLLAASSGHRLRFWDVASGKERHDRPGEFGYTPALAVSPDGRLLAAADWLDRAVSVWDTHSGRRLRRLPLKGGEERYVRNLAFSADGTALVGAQHQGLLRFWDAATGKEERTLQLHDPDHPNKNYVYFYQLHLSSDGKRVSTLERIMRPEATRLALWEATTGKLLRQHPLPAQVREPAWSADGLTVALPLNDGLTLMEVDTGVVRFRIPGTASGEPPATSPDGRLLAARRTAGGQPPTVGVWEAATGKEVVTVPTGRVAHLALAPDDRSLVTSDEGFLRVWDLTTGKERRRWPLPVAVTDSWGKTFVFRLLLSPDGRRAFTALADGTCLVWDLSPALRPAEPLVERPAEKEIAGWWADLAGEDAGRAYGAAWRLAEAPGAVAFLRRHLRPATDADFKKARQLIAGLDSDSFEAREKASRQLEALGGAAVPALREALAAKPSAEARRRLETLLARASQAAASPEVLRRLRAVLVLEQAASKEARDLLAQLAAGVPYAAETREAKAALGRLKRSADAASPGPRSRVE
jgi:WD40 repeat protein